MLKRLINKYFDYDGKGHGKKKYIKRYKLRPQYRLFKRG